MKQDTNEFVNINDAKNILKSNGLAYLSQIVYHGRTVNVGKRMYITQKQLENCLKKDFGRQAQFC